MLESIFVAQQATLITHGHIQREEFEKPRFHIWPLLCTYKTAEEAIARWKASCPTMNGDSCCTPGHHFTRITQYPLNTPESYYQKWGTDSYMAQYNYLRDELRRVVVYPPGKSEKEHGKMLGDASINHHIYFGDDGKELLDPKNYYVDRAQNTNYFSAFNGRGSDLGWHFKNWWLRDHGFINKDAPPVTAKEVSPEGWINPRYFAQLWTQLLWPEGDNPNGW